MFAVTVVFVGLLGLAVASATVAYRHSGETVWYREFNNEGMGLTIELALLALVVVAGAAILVIMRDSFTTLFLEGGWRSTWFLVFAGVVLAGVSIYLVRAPATLAERHNVASRDVHVQCVRPYLMYAPFSIVLWLGLLLPVVAVLGSSIHSDYANIGEARRELERSGGQVLVLAAAEPDAARDHVAIYGLEYREAIDTVQRAVTRYLWVVGVFLLFLIVMLNTRITSAYSEVAQDSFKLLMWAFALIAVAICLLGLTQYQQIRDLAITTHERLAATAENSGQLDLVVATKEALLELRADGPAHFLRSAVLAGIWLVAFGYGFQIVLAKITHRSAMGTIFPRRVARFLDGFIIGPEEPPPPRP